MDGLKYVRRLIINQMENTYKLKQKAWKIDFSKIEEGFCYADEICHAETLNKAKSILLKRQPDLRLAIFDEDVTYLNIPVERDETNDLFEFENQDLTIHKINEIIYKREREKELDLILNNSKVTHCLIVKRGEYYRENWAGYTENYFDAGIYLKNEAISHAKGCSEITIKVIDNLEHNQKINQKIENLKSKLL